MSRPVPSRPQRAWPGWLILIGGGALAVYLLQPAPPQAPPEMSQTPGVRLIYRLECGKCHTLQALPDVRGTLGPPLDGIGRRAGARRSGLSARQYLIESLQKPEAFRAEGYLNTMPSYAGLSPAELNELVDYLEKQ